ncbi:hypothetical protein JQC72_01655 [Polycladomyces sp. WAk]|uniref:Lipoprotein n=1 Tax=Polycladomyces zharkentensis TaxID=2807616 RepID=A0ABS2WFN5_9BACL|nr:hypothetical protein [Polycladomyces sp. WAk]MBN2908225.1 hypothetical protein [Polycladomyces sp. WAk]
MRTRLVFCFLALIGLAGCAWFLPNMFFDGGTIFDGDRAYSVHPSIVVPEENVGDAVGDSNGGIVYRINRLSTKEWLAMCPDHNLDCFAYQENHLPKLDIQRFDPYQAEIRPTFGNGRIVTIRDPGKIRLLIDTFLTRPDVKSAHQRHKRIKLNRLVQFYSKKYPSLIYEWNYEVDADGRRYLMGDGKVVELGDVLKREIR